MRTFTDEELKSLIACPKQVIAPPRREMRLDGKMKRNDMTLKSADGKHEFRVFMRQNDEFPENFSIGLMYLPNEEPGSFQLLRCNGQHGGERVHPHHAAFHSTGAKRTTSTPESWNPGTSRERTPAPPLVVAPVSCRPAPAATPARLDERSRFIGFAGVFTRGEIPSSTVSWRRFSAGGGRARPVGVEMETPPKECAPAVS